jgi:beta-N-acetylhexosaminidase
MPKQPIFKIFTKQNLLTFIVVVAGVFTFIISYFTNLSLTAGVRFYVLYGWLVVLLGLIFTARKFFQKSGYFKIISLILWVLLLVNIINLSLFEYRKFRFFSSGLDTSDHLVAGFRNEKEVLKLVQKNKLAGVYFTARNVQNKSPNEIRNFIQSLQKERFKHSDKALLIMADQEGGIVSHLSPPLTLTISLKEAYEKGEIADLAKIHGKELQEIGVNVNLGPVADLDSPAGAGGYSQISSRSVSDDPQVVQKAVREYCLQLQKFEVKCTLKHFPGIGKVSQDTHFELGRIEANLEQVLADSQGFKSLETEHLVMLSHTLVMAIDDRHPMSVSSKGVRFLRSINPEAKTITDDMSMLPISQDIGIKKAYQMSLSAGVDYVLISYDKDLVYWLRQCIVNS